MIPPEIKKKPGKRLYLKKFSDFDVGLKVNFIFLRFLKTNTADCSLLISSLNPAASFSVDHGVYPTGAERIS